MRATKNLLGRPINKTPILEILILNRSVYVKHVKFHMVQNKTIWRGCL